MPLPDYRVLSVACYGTLIDREAGLHAALRPLVALAGVTLDRASLLAAFERHERAHRADMPDRPYADALLAAHRALAQEWGAICTADDHALFAHSVPHWPAFPDAPGALQYLRRYFRIVVVTDADRESVEASARRLDARFETVVTPHDTGACKPDRRVFEHLLACLGRLGATPGQTLHAGHSVAHDLRPAAAAGLRVAWIDRGGSGTATTECDYAFANLATLVRAHQDQLRA
jgi:2-haloacid dehalogenase